MPKKKTTQQSSQTNTYSFMNPPDTQDTIALRNQINSAYDTPDPTIPYSFARRREQVGNRFSNPFGHNYSPEVADAIKYNDINELDQEQGVANRMDRFNRRQAKTQALGGLASQTAPRAFQTGSSGTGTQTTPFDWGNLIGVGAQIGSAFL